MSSAATRHEVVTPPQVPQVPQVAELPITKVPRLLPASLSLSTALPSTAVPHCTVAIDSVQIYCRVIDEVNGLNYTAYASPHASWAANHDEVPLSYGNKRFTDIDEAREYRKQFSRKSTCKAPPSCFQAGVSHNLAPTDPCWYNPDDPDDVTMQEGGEWVLSDVIWGIVMLALAISPCLCLCGIKSCEMYGDRIHDLTHAHYETHGRPPDSSSHKFLESLTSRSNHVMRSTHGHVQQEKQNIRSLRTKMSRGMSGALGFSEAAEEGEGEANESAIKPSIADSVDVLFDKLDQCKDDHLACRDIIRALSNKVLLMDNEDVQRNEKLKVPFILKLKKSKIEVIGESKFATFCKAPLTDLLHSIHDKMDGASDASGTNNELVSGAVGHEML